MIRIVIIILILLSKTPYSQKTPLKIMTYNIRYDNPDDGANRWSLRKEILADQIKFYDPDIIGFQEVLYNQLAYLDSSLTEYNYVGVGREDGKTKGEFNCIFFKKRFEIIMQSTFWLSETPDKVSIGWDAALERICTYAFLQDKTSDQRIRILNTHFDHMGQVAQYNSAQLIIEKINSFNENKIPVLLMGDFNFEPGCEPYGFITNYLNDAKQTAENGTYGPDGTYNAFEVQKPANKRIDYIFTSRKNVQVKKYSVPSECRNGRFPSDHFPVYILISINE